MSSTYKYFIWRLLAGVYAHIFQGFNCGLVLFRLVCVCYLQILKMNGLKLKLVFKEGKKYWKFICLCNTVQFIDSLTLVISFATSTVKFQDLQLTRKTSLEIAFL